MTKLTPFGFSCNGIPELKTRLCRPSYIQLFNGAGLCILIKLILLWPITADEMFTNSFTNVTVHLMLSHRLLMLSVCEWKFHCVFCPFGLPIWYAEDWHLVGGMQIILGKLKFDRHLYQYFIHFLSALPSLEKTLKWMSHCGLYTSSTPLLCDKFIICFEKHVTIFQSLTLPTSNM